MYLSIAIQPDFGVCNLYTAFHYTVFILLRYIYAGWLLIKIFGPLNPLQKNVQKLHSVKWAKTCLLCRCGFLWVPPFFPCIAFVGSIRSPFDEALCFGLPGGMGSFGINWYILLTLHLNVDKIRPCFYFANCCFVLQKHLRAGSSLVWTMLFFNSKTKILSSVRKLQNSLRSECD